MKKVLVIAWPIILSYVPIGLSCGFLASRCGVSPLMGLLMSYTLVTGSGQFMISNLWLAGLPALSIIASVSAVSLRFALYSASLAPYLKKASKRMSLALAFTLVEEGYGITLAKLADGDREWTLRHALALNIVTISAWSVSVSAGCALGGLVDIPTAIVSFTMTSLFIYLDPARQARQRRCGCELGGRRRGLQAREPHERGRALGRRGGGGRGDVRLRQIGTSRRHAAPKGL